MPLPMTVPTTTAVAWLRRRSRASSGRASVVCGLVAMEGAKSIVENLAILLRQGEDLSEEKEIAPQMFIHHIFFAVFAIPVAGFAVKSCCSGGRCGIGISLRRSSGQQSKFIASWDPDC